MLASKLPKANLVLQERLRDRVAELWTWGGYRNNEFEKSDRTCECKGNPCDWHEETGATGHTSEGNETSLVLLQIRKNKYVYLKFFWTLC